MAIEFNSVPYKSLVNSGNTFNQPRQKTWGVFIINDYTEVNGDLVTLNYDTVGSAQWSYIYSDTGKRETGYTYPVKGYKSDYTPPIDMLSPTGEKIIATTDRYIFDVDNPPEELEGSSAARRYYNESDLQKVKLYSYTKLIRTTSWDLVLVTRNLQEAKRKMNDWLRQPDTSRPKVGIDTVIITEIIPADSVVEL
jgi:hypothetical protein